MALESQGTKLEMAGSGAAAVIPTAIAVGYPTIFTKTAHGLLAGDIVTLALFRGADAGLLNSEVCVLEFVTANTMAVKINTIGKTITVDGSTTITPKSWTNIGEVVDINKEDPGANEIEVTHLLSTSKEYLMGLQDSGTVTFTVNFLFDDVGQQALHTAKGDRAVREFKVTYPSTDTMTFDGFVQTFNGPGVAVDDKLVGDVSIKISGDVTFA